MQIAQGVLQREIAKTSLAGSKEGMLGGRYNLGKNRNKKAGSGPVWSSCWPEHGSVKEEQGRMSGSLRICWKGAWMRGWYHLSGKLVSLFIRRSLTLGTSTIKIKLFHVGYHHLPMILSLTPLTLCKRRFASGVKDGVARSRVVAVRMEGRGWEWDSSGTDTAGLWPVTLVDSARGDGHFVSVAQENAEPAVCQLECWDTYKGLAEKHGKNHNSKSLRVLSDLTIPFYSACRKGSSQWSDNPRKNVLVLTVNELNW